MRRSSLGLLAGLAVLLIGCGSVPDGAADAEALECPPGTEGCDDVLPVGPGGEVEVEMGDFYFEFADGAAVTGDVQVEAHNVSDQVHNFEVLGAAEGSEVPEAAGGETVTGTVKLFPGEWTVICNIPGHRAAGMESTLTVYSTEEEAEAAIEAGETDADRDAADAAA